MNNISYLLSGQKEYCFGCSACEQICPVSAIQLVKDSEGFRYPQIDNTKCIYCNVCQKICPFENDLERNSTQIVFGGYSKNPNVRKESTSGGAFSEIVQSLFSKGTIIYGATANGLDVHHIRITDINDLCLLRKSKYLQSNLGDSFKMTKKDLIDGKKVIFSGTPCQISGLNSFLGSDKNRSNLLTIEVVCEGVPSPLYFESLNEYLYKKYKGFIESIDFRNKDKSKWDFEVMKLTLTNKKILYYDRWVNPFWYIWLNHLMSRPSCYNCPLTNSKRSADITLGDLWGVHIYCPELYGKNGGSSIILVNTRKGQEAFEKAQPCFIGHYLDYNTMLKYQGPLQHPIPPNNQRNVFICDLQKLNYKTLIKQWYKKPSPKLLFSKYIWGNKQKVELWKIKNYSKKRKYYK
jgi:coenzyme F420-reducing hydrogenase beta subunit